MCPGGTLAAPQWCHGGTLVYPGGMPRKLWAHKTFYIMLKTPEVATTMFLFDHTCSRVLHVLACFNHVGFKHKMAT